MNRANRQQPLILFDGVCNLCQRSVQFVIRNDASGQFQFASLQSEVAASMLQKLDFQGDELGSVLLIVDTQIFQKSRAALQIAKRLDRPWPVFYYLFFWVPPFLANWIYSFIGNRRYAWFGKKEQCWIPDATLASRFIDQEESAD